MLSDVVNERQLSYIMALDVGQIMVIVRNRVASSNFNVNSWDIFVNSILLHEIPALATRLDMNVRK